MSDVSFSVNEPTFERVFNRFYPSIKLPFDGSNSLGPLWLGVDAEIHIEGVSDIDFEDEDTFLVKELEIGWDKLVIRLGLDIPDLEVGKFCVFRFPDDVPIFGGECVLEFPGGTLFDGNPDIGPLTLNLNAIIEYVVTEISARFRIAIEKDKNHQLVFAHVHGGVDVDPISISDTAGKLPAILKVGVAAAAVELQKLVPQTWLLNYALGLLGMPTITELLLNLLDIHDDTEEWLMDKLNVGIGIDNLIAQALLTEVLKKHELFEIDDPFPFVSETTAKTSDYGEFSAPPTIPEFTIPEVSAPLANPSATFDEDHLWIRFDFGM